MGTKGKVFDAGITGNYKYYSAAQTAANIKVGSGVLVRIIVGKKGAGEVKLYDATAGTGSQFVGLDTENREGHYEFGANFTTGLRIVKTGNAQVTLVYR